MLGGRVRESQGAGSKSVSELHFHCQVDDFSLWGVSYGVGLPLVSGLTGTWLLEVPEAINPSKSII